ncbi:suppressor APC domain-containing protein 2-like [Dreissena polymorpha]|uniref:suppressor APC domain-containing protein 2-like n=1 Tax=Dreissena polymorpha TaxID=45954 RepID=UPI002264B5DA|nr:suppressor APC domain-containing protein 2-like [Dreissena polymorpha]
MSNKQMNGNSNVVDGLPKQFVTSLRVLFDILDEDQTGFVRLRDIETRWHEEGVKGLPGGVIDALRKVAPRNGKLTFENFVTGLKQSLLKNSQASSSTSCQSEKVAQNRSSNANGKEKPGSVVSNGTGQVASGRSASLSTDQSSKRQSSKRPEKTDYPQFSHNYANMVNYVNIEGPVITNIPTTAPEKSQIHVVQRSKPMLATNTQPAVTTNTAMVRPNNMLQSQNTELRNHIYTREQMQHSTLKPHSKPPDYQYTHETDRGAHHDKRHSDDISHYLKNDQMKPALRPKSALGYEHSQQRPKEVHFHTKSTDVTVPPGRPERPPPYLGPKDREDTPPALPPKNMQARIMRELKTWQREHKLGTDGTTAPVMHSSHSDSNMPRMNRSPGHNIYVNLSDLQRLDPSTQSVQASREGDGGRRLRRQNSRRHTLSSGIDYNVIRRMKQLEQERDVLLQGLEVVERARDWYLKQVALVTERQNHAEKTSCSDASLQNHQERMDFVRSRINDVNLNLKSLMETTESGFPAHMNLAIRSSVISEDISTRWLKDQNKQLTKEVGEKSELITQLEKEKATLIRDLFEARVKHKTNYDDTTFM